MKIKFILLAAALSFTMSAAAQNAPAKPDYQFTTIKENPITPVKNQYRSGTCWCYSALSFIESEILRTKGQEVDVLHVIGDYGIVPQDAMPGLCYGSDKPEHFEMDAALKGYVDAIKSNPNNTLTTAWVKGMDGIIEAYLGEYPEKFTVAGTEYTPESYRDYLGINPDDYVNLTSFTHHPFYKPFVIEVCDNWRWDSAWNLPVDELMEVMYNAIEKGYTIAWGSDVSEKGFTRNGIAVALQEKTAAGGSDQERWVGKSNEEKAAEAAEFPEEVSVTQEMRQEGYDRKTTTDDHGMHIYGLAQDQNGTKYFMVKNSWGESGKYKGIWYASDAFVRYKTLNIVVHKDALPKDIKKKLGIK